MRKGDSNGAELGKAFVKKNGAHTHSHKFKICSLEYVNLVPIQCLFNTGLLF